MARYKRRRDWHSLFMSFLGWSAGIMVVILWVAGMMFTIKEIYHF